MRNKLIFGIAFMILLLANMALAADKDTNGYTIDQAIQRAKSFQTKADEILTSIIDKAVESGAITNAEAETEVANGMNDPESVTKDLGKSTLQKVWEKPAGKIGAGGIVVLIIVLMVIAGRSARKRRREKKKGGEIRTDKVKIPPVPEETKEERDLRELMEHENPFDKPKEVWNSWVSDHPEASFEGREKLADTKIAAAYSKLDGFWQAFNDIYGDIVTETDKIEKQFKNRSLRYVKDPKDYNKVIANLTQLRDHVLTLNSVEKINDYVDEHLSPKGNLDKKYDKILIEFIRTAKENPTDDGDSILNRAISKDYIKRGKVKFNEAEVKTHFTYALTFPGELKLTLTALNDLRNYSAALNTDAKVKAYVEGHIAPKGKISKEYEDVLTEFINLAKSHGWSKDGKEILREAINNTLAKDFTMRVDGEEYNINEIKTKITALQDNIEEWEVLKMENQHKEARKEVS
ncbi:hypothetical protein JXA85_05485 [Candidatus Woesearchaeota archaeon]|nr:hypothetical protein [Candidatus Woesearchaeota archaeon]